MKYWFIAFLALCTTALAQQTVPPFQSTANAPHVVFIGDSVTALWAGPAFIPEAEGLGGYPTWTKILSGYRFNAQVATDKFAVGGYTTANMLNVVPDALARKPDVCVIMGGANDVFLAAAPVGNETLVGSTIYNLNRMYNQLQDGNCIIFAIKIISLNFANWPAGAPAKAFQINQWIEQQNLIRKGFYVLDLGNVYDDPANTTHWQPKPHYVTPANNLHPSTWGAYAIGQALAAQINLLYPDWRLQIQNVDDVYSAANNPTGNLLPNQMFVGTGGTITGGTPTPTGTVAAGWTLFGTNSGGMTVVASQTTTPDGRPAQTITLSGTSTGGFIDLRSANVTVGNVGQGDVIECSVDASWGATTNVELVAPIMVSTEGGINYFPQILSGAQIADAGNMLPTETSGGGGPATSLSIPLYTPQHKTSEPPSVFGLSIRITKAIAAAGSAIAGTFQFASPSCRKILPVTVPGQ